MTQSHQVPAFAPPEHPTVSHGKIGVLIANLGTPDATDYWSMRRYLNEFLSDQRVVDLPRWKWQPILQLIILSLRPTRSGRNYASIWNNEANESPLLTITRAQSNALAAEIGATLGDEVIVDFCMRYGNPSTEMKVKSLIAQGCQKILFFPLYPHNAGATWATANDQFFRVLMAETWQPAIRTVPPYFDNPQFIDALAGSVLQGYAPLPEKPETLVVSYHGMPQRYLEQGDPYYCHCVKTTRLLRDRLGWDDQNIITAFQSKFGRDEWLGPATVNEVARLAKDGKRNIAVIAPAFSADCIETLEEIKEEIRESFVHAGGESFTYIPCLNAERPHIDLIASIVRDNLAGWI